VYKKYGPHEWSDGFPGYFTLQIFSVLLPSFLFHKLVRDFVNWRALSFTIFVILVTSLLWEATLGVPYQWWGYHPNQMMGIFIYAWDSLPIEATLLWPMGSYSAIIVYEFVRLYLQLGRPPLSQLFSRKQTA
jgi:hypothetical protein